MEFRKWKDILLQWITKCDFLAQEIEIIEESDINEFYRTYCEHHNVARELEKDNLVEFLKEQYPDFDMTLDNEGNICPADYVFYYTLCLHFAYVKHPEEYFYGVWLKLTDELQQYIGKFFKHMLKCEIITKEAIRCAIENPTTDRTSILIYNLKAQLHRERSIKKLLEAQIQEQKKLKLKSDDQKQLQVQQHTQNNDQNAIDDNKVEAENPSLKLGQIKTGVCNDTTQVSSQMSKFKNMMISLTDAENVARDDQQNVDRNVALCMQHTKSLLCTLDGLSVNLEGNLKSLGAGGSSPYVVVPDSKKPRSCSCTSTYLLCKKLQEKEFENTQLREQLSQMFVSGMRLTGHIQGLIAKYSKECELIIPQKTTEADIEIFGYATKDLLILFDCIKDLGKNYKHTKNRLKKCEQNVELLQKKLTEQERNTDDLLQEKKNLQLSVTSLEATNAKLSRSKSEIRDNLAQCLDDNSLINEQNNKLVMNVENLVRQYQLLRDGFKAEKKEYAEIINGLQENLTIEKSQNTALNNNNDKLIEQIAVNQSKFQSLERLLTEKTDLYNSDLTSLTAQLENKKKEAEMCRLAQISERDKFKNLYIRHINLKQHMNAIDGQLEYLRNNIALKEYEKSRLNSKIVDMLTKNSELEKRIENMMDQITGTGYISKSLLGQKNERKIKLFSKTNKKKKISGERNEQEVFGETTV